MIVTHSGLTGTEVVGNATPSITPTPPWSNNEDSIKTFHDTVQSVAQGMRATRTAATSASFLQPVQYFYGSVSPTRDDIEPMLSRIQVDSSPSSLAVQHNTENVGPVKGENLYIMIFNVDTLGRDTEASIRPYANFLQALWSTSAATKAEGSVVLIADDVYRSAVAEMVEQVIAEVPSPTTWTILCTWVRAFDPPSLDLGMAQSSIENATKLNGLLPLLCCGTALGILQQLPLFRSSAACITPVDVALNVALLGLIFLKCGKLPLCHTISQVSTPLPGKPSRATASVPSVSPSTHQVAALSIGEESGKDCSLAWGFVGECLIGYYGRFQKEIEVVFPVPGILCSSPHLHYLFSLQDAANFGVQTRAALLLIDTMKARQRRDELIRTRSNPETARALEAQFTQLDHAIALLHVVAQQEKTMANLSITSSARTPILSSGAYTLGEFNSNGYHQLLRRLTANYSWMPYHQYVALTEIDWEAYILAVARASLCHLAARTFHKEGGTQLRPSDLPPLFRNFTNDVIYHGAGRLPPYPTFMDRNFSSCSFIHRVGLDSNGFRGVVSPGMFPERLAAILAQPEIQNLLTGLAAEGGVNRSILEKKAEKILLRIGDTLNNPQLRSLGAMVRQIFSRMFDKISLSTGAYELLMRLSAMPRVEVVLVPLHRSYIDFLVLSLLLVTLRFPPPHIVAGEDFLGMGAFAEMMRGSGAFFMRRSFRGDPLYAALFKEYVRQLVRHRQPVEFFIEGTRSRTNTTMAPKMGILKFICDAFFESRQHEIDDVLFVPVGLSYDELLEATVYAKELLGVPKPKETFMNMLKATSTMNKRHGSIHIHFGEVISLRSFLDRPVQCPLPYQPKTQMVELPLPASQSPSSGNVLQTAPIITKAESLTPPHILSSVSWHLVHRLQSSIVVTPASLVAAVVECIGPYVMMAKVGNALNPELPLSLVEQEVSWLREILRQRDGKLSDVVSKTDVKRAVRVGLGNLARYLCVDDSGMVIFSPNDTVSQLAVHISANQIIHLCMDEAIVVVVAQAHGKPAIPHAPPNANGKAQCGMQHIQQGVLETYTRLLHKLLAVEFPIYANSAPRSFESWLQCTVGRLTEPLPPGAVAVTEAPLQSATAPSTSMVHIPVSQYYYFLLQLIYPHMEALYVVLLVAIAMRIHFPGKGLSIPRATRAIQKASEALHRSGILLYVVTLNKETLQHYFECLVSLKLMTLHDAPRTKGGDGKEVKSQGSAADDVIAQLRTLCAQTQTLRWHARRTPQETDEKTIQESVIEVYSELMQLSKM